jgi:hypothetical protein
MTERPEHDRRLIDRVTSPTFVEGLDDLPLPVLLERIEQCGRAVLEYSYLRRLVQGRIDILDAVLGGGTGDLAAVLPAVLARSGDESSHVRFRRGHLLELLRAHLPEEMYGIAGILFPADPPIRVPEWIPAAGRREVDRVLRDDLLSRLDDAAGAEVAEARRHAAELERSISVTRRTVLDVADALERAALRRLKGPAAPEETRRIIEWMCSAYVRHPAAAGGPVADPGE